MGQIYSQQRNLQKTLANFAKIENKITIAIYISKALKPARTTCPVHCVDSVHYTLYRESLIKGGDYNLCTGYVQFQKTQFYSRNIFLSPHMRYFTHKSEYNIKRVVLRTGCSKSPRRNQDIFQNSFTFLLCYLYYDLGVIKTIILSYQKMIERSTVCHDDREYLFSCQIWCGTYKKTYFWPKKTCVQRVFFGQKFDFLKTCCIKSVMELVLYIKKIKYLFQFSFFLCNYFILSRFT